MPAAPATSGLGEAERLQRLQALELLDSPPDAVLDGLVRVAARVLDCPVALVSLVDGQRQWFKSAHGVATRQTPRDVAFCHYTIQGDGLFEVPDATRDPRFADSPLVQGEPGIRFYAGMPIGIDGLKLGTFCVIDRKPRLLREDERELMLDLSRAAEHLLESHHRHRQALQHERAFRQLAEQTPALVYQAACDATWTPLYVNPRLADFGYQPQQWLGVTEAWWQAVHPDDRERVVQQRGQALARGETVELDYRLRDADGRWRDVHDVARPWTPQQQGATVLQGVLFDVSERRREQDWQRKISAAVEQASEAIVITDLDGCIEYVNQAVERSTGHARADLLGRNPRIFASGQTPPAVYRELWQSLTAGVPWRGLLHNRTRSGEPLLELATISPVRNECGQVTHYLAVKEDVTEKEHLRAELEHYHIHLEALVARRTAELAEAKAAAESANAAKSAFLATMSHEIRTPMNAVIGIIELLGRSALPDAQRSLCVTARDSAEALLRLIDDVLDVSKIEAGRMVLQPAPLQPLRVAVGACDALLPLAAARGVMLHTFVDPGVAEVLLGDALRLRQIITNLVGNAIKFSAGLERRGRVALRVEPLHGPGMRLSVIDNGIGIDEGMRARLFKPFEQSVAGNGPTRGGTGLGLAITQRLVLAMGGRIDVHSQPGAGSRFDVELPLPAPPAQGPQATAAATMRGLLAGLSVRVWADDEQRATDWCRYLSWAGAIANGAAQGDVPAGDDGTEGTPALCVVLADSAAHAAVGSRAAVVLRHGERRHPRREAPMRFALDADVLHRDELVRSVAWAAGRRTPDAAPAVATTATEAIPGARALPAAEADRLPPPLVGQRVLVAEDNPVNREVLSHQLERLGLQAEFAVDGAEALARWRAAGPDFALLLTDLQMPVMDGFALAAAIRRAEGGAQRLPIVALSAHVLPSEIGRSRAAGVDDHLTKPLRLEQLRAAMLRWLPRPRIIARHDRTTQRPAGRQGIRRRCWWTWAASATRSTCR
jgi:PAS domain S-box-containing protein